MHLRNNAAALAELTVRCRRGQVTAPFVPRVKGAGDTSNFDPYDEEPLNSSPTELFPREFAEF